MIVDLSQGRFHLHESILSEYRGRPVNWGFGALSEVTYARTYSREMEGGGQEQWYQTCQRVVEGTFTVLRNHCLSLHLPWNDDEAQHKAADMMQRMFTFKFLPPGRGLWMMGTDFVYTRSGAPLNNCAFRSTQHIDVDYAAPFSWTFEMLMLGVGVGFDTRGKGKVEIVRPERTQEPFLVKDSRQGWCEALEIVLDAYVGKGALPKSWDVSQVRPQGTPIKSFGGVASGPEPLVQMLERLEGLYDANIGAKVDSALIVDTMNIVGACVVSGGVRRSAQIAFGEPNDDQFMDLKLDKEKLFAWRWASNNSLFAEQGMDYTASAARTAENGEPGYAWLDTMRAYGRMADPINWKDERVMGGNPCVTADTIIMTSQGPRRANQLLDTPFEAFVDGGAYACRTGFFKTGTKPVFELLTEEGLRVRVTEDHKILHVPRLTEKKRYETWVEAGDLLPGDQIVVNNARELTTWDGMGTSEQGWLLGSMLGDGHIHHDTDGTATCKLQYWGPSKEAMLATALEYVETLGGDERYHKMRSGTEVADRDMVSTGSRKLYALMREFGIDDDKNIVSDNLMLSSSEFHRGFLRGLFDADGSVQGDQNKGVSIRLRAKRRQHLHVVQQMLLHLGIHSKVYEERQPEGYNTLPDGKGGVAEYWCEAVHGLIISKDNLFVYRDRVGFEEPAKIDRLNGLLDSYVRRPNRERFVATVSAVNYVGIEDVYDCTVDEVHRFSANNLIVHNCLEQSLEDGELCCLVETFPAHHATLEDYQSTLKMAYMYAKAVTLVPTHDRLTNAIVLRNRRIGCSMSGIVQAAERHGYRNFIRWCDTSYKFLQQVDKSYSEWLAIPRSIKMTSVKPSGTVSLLAGATPGVHFDHAEHYIRRVRVSDTSPIVQSCRDAGYHVEADQYSDATSVISFPIKSAYYKRGKSDVGIWEKVDLAAAMQRWWADNQVSCTVDFKQEEASDIARILERYEDKLKGISFLPSSDHGYAQAPYETCDKDTFESMSKGLKPVNLHDTGHEVTERFCDGDSCTIT